MMRVLLLYPSYKPQADPPLGPLYIASFLEAQGVEVRVMDRLKAKGLEDVKAVMEQFKPMVVGLSLTTPLFPIAQEVSAFIKAYYPEAWVVMGGPHPSCVPMDCLEQSQADFVVVGEGEEIVHNLCLLYPQKEKAQGIKGLFWREGEVQGNKGLAPRTIEELNSLPFPARHLVDMRGYLTSSVPDRRKWSLPQPSLALLASRGCPYKCAFCASPMVQGRKLRLRSPENLRAELEALIETYGIRGAYFLDDSFTLNHSWLIQVCQILDSLKLKWICGSRVDSVNSEVLKTMKEAGCVLISYGIESGDQVLLDEVLKKGIKIEEAKEAFSMTKKAGIQTLANFILGFPGEDTKSIEKTLRLSLNLGADAAEFSIYTPLPGTPLAQTAGDTMAEWSRLDFAKALSPTCQLSQKALKKYQTRALLGFYLRPFLLARRLLAMKSREEAMKNLWALRSFLSLWRRKKTP